MLVAIAALVVAASGTAIAAGGLVAGDKLIKPRSLSANRLRNHSITGLQVSLGKLGRVPSAARAFVAGSAQNAVNAQDAAIATNAKNAAALGGRPASAYEPAANFARTGLVTAATGQTVPLASFGPFTLSLRCSAGSAEIQASSSEPNSVAFGASMAGAGTPYTVVPSPSSGRFANQSGSFLTPSGKTYAGVATVGLEAAGFSAPCVANALISSS
jgi:hypothetical protein